MAFIISCVINIKNSTVHICAVLTACFSGVLDFELETNFDDGTATRNGLIFSNFGF